MIEIKISTLDELAFIIKLIRGDELIEQNVLDLSEATNTLKKAIDEANSNKQLKENENA